jgi:hypothetical protein
MARVGSLHGSPKDFKLLSYGVSERPLEMNERHHVPFYRIPVSLDAGFRHGFSIQFEPSRIFIA